MKFTLLLVVSTFIVYTKSEITCYSSSTYDRNLGMYYNNIRMNISILDKVISINDMYMNLNQIHYAYNDSVWISLN